MQYVIFLFITANLFLEKQENRLLTVLNEVKRIDSLVSSMQDEQQVYVLTKNSDSPSKVVNRKWPREIIETYNLLSDDQGGLIYFLINPYSESGDRKVYIRYYFDNQGSLLATKFVHTFFDDTCTGEIVKEERLRVYDKSATWLNTIGFVKLKTDNGYIEYSPNDACEPQFYDYEPKVFGHNVDLLTNKRLN